MKKHILHVLAVVIFQTTFTFGQGDKSYPALIAEAWKLFASKQFLESGEKYSEAFLVAGTDAQVPDRYNAACAWALANQSDSSFVQLFKIARHGNFTNLGHLLADPDLNALHSDKRWNELVDIVNQNNEKAEAKFDRPLVAMLDTVYLEDQNDRRKIGEIEKEYGRQSEEMRMHWKIIQEKDSINLIKVKHILDTRGWLGPDVVGQQGNGTLFLVIQHADPETQRKYLPMMREAAANGNARPADLALLEDRVALGLGKRQTYGSQIGQDQETGKYYVLPLDDPDNVDKRRASVGLSRLQDYIAMWGMTWDVEEYKKQLPGIEAKQKR
jgi:hypothetical protein